MRGCCCASSKQRCALTWYSSGRLWEGLCGWSRAWRTSLAGTSGRCALATIASGWLRRAAGVEVEARRVDGQGRRRRVRILRPWRSKAAEELKVASSSRLRLETRDALPGSYALVLLFVLFEVLEVGVVKLAARLPLQALGTAALVHCISVVD